MRKALVSARLCALAMVLALSPSTLLAQHSDSLRAVECPGMTVSSLDSAVEFYSRVLDFHEESLKEFSGEAYEHLEGLFGSHARVAHLRLGDECLDLTEYLAPAGRPAPVDLASDDLRFQHIAIVVADMEKAYDRLRQHHARFVSSSPQTLPLWNSQAGGIKAFYFKDPDGHPLELIQYPEGKGEARWHGQHQGLFLGIDHTAIVVSDTDASVHFYKDLLGFKVSGTSENYGTEQEHLANVFGAHLIITSLRAPAGPGIELLQYLPPNRSRGNAREVIASDVLHWQTRLVVAHLDALVAETRLAHVNSVSTNVIDTSGLPLGFKRAVLIADPDGHEMDWWNDESSRKSIAAVRRGAAAGRVSQA